MYERILRVLVEFFIKDYKTTDNGARGKAFERAVRAIFGLDYSTTRTAKQTDLIKYNRKNERITIEIKTGSCELQGIDENGHIISSIDRNRYVIYKATDSSPILVCRADRFLEVARDTNMLRFKKSTNGYRNGLNYPDRVTLKTINDGTSAKARDKFINALSDYCALDLERFCKMQGFKMALDDDDEFNKLFDIARGLTDQAQDRPRNFYVVGFFCTSRLKAYGQPMLTLKCSVSRFKPFQMLALNLYYEHKKTSCRALQSILKAY